mmetsp:Transcript_2433/g.6215  ORF Transcript_2433/g.6215 Transcript_2433/m.6215 type:complete len:224 (-) Transcript_2433:392-1063(-)
MPRYQVPCANTASQPAPTVTLRDRSPAKSVMSLRTAAWPVARPGGCPRCRKAPTRLEVLAVAATPTHTWRVGSATVKFQYRQLPGTWPVTAVTSVASSPSVATGDAQDSNPRPGSTGAAGRAYAPVHAHTPAWQSSLAYRTSSGVEEHSPTKPSACTASGQDDAAARSDPATGPAAVARRHKYAPLLSASGPDSAPGRPRLASRAHPAPTCARPSHSVVGPCG